MLPKKREIEISPLAFAKVIDWVSSNTEREVGGYLVGKVEKGIVIISDATFAVAESTPVHVTFDNMAQYRIIEELERKGVNETIIGFWHSHPGIGCFMSGTDISTQKTYQALLPEAVAMVNDGNNFARSRQLSDFQAHFYRVAQDNSYFEVNFGIITDPNDLLQVLTRHIQDEENPEKIAESTAQKFSLELGSSLEALLKKKTSQEEFQQAVLGLKKGLAATRRDLEKLSAEQIPKKELQKSLGAINKTQEQLQELAKYFQASTKRQTNEIKLLRVLVIGAIIVSLLGLIAAVSLLIINFLP